MVSRSTASPEQPEHAVTSPSTRKPCPLCGTTDARPLFKRFGYDIVRCRSCDLIYLDFRMDRDTAAAFYSAEYFTGGEDRNGYVDYVGDREHHRLSFRRKLGEVEKMRRPGTILDIGCAAGFFLEEARDRGWQVYGQEISEFASAEAREALGDCIFTGDVDAVDLPPGSLDVVTMWDVVEHLENPLETLARVREWLKDDGLLVLCTGNISSWFARVQGRRSRIYNPPQHLCYFSADSMEKLLRRSGLRIVKRDTDSKTMSLAYVLFILAHINSNPVTRFLDRRVGHSPVGRRSLTIPLFDNMRIWAVKD